MPSTTDAALLVPAVAALAFGYLLGSIPFGLLLTRLTGAGDLRSIGSGIDYPADVWSSIQARVAEMRGPMSVARLRDELRTSRRHAEAILAALRRDRDRRAVR